MLYSVCMKTSQKGSASRYILILVLVVIIAVAAYIYIQNSSPVAVSNNPNPPSSGTTTPPAQNTYTNSQYGFQMTFPASWNGFSVATSSWTGNRIDGVETFAAYTGPEIIFKNPQTTSAQQWQDIPIMVFTPSQWALVEQEKLAVSAAPIGPAKVGENTKYIFATPPRWYGFTDATGTEEAVSIVKTFKAF